MSNSLKLLRIKGKYGWYRKIKYKQRKSQFLYDKVRLRKMRKKFKNNPIEEEIFEGDWADQHQQKPSKKKKKSISRREEIRRRRREKRKQQERYLKGDD